MQDIDFTGDDFSDIVAKDDRFHARGYSLLTDVIRYLGERGRHFSGEDILEEFKERALDQYGPMTFRVLDEWGIHRCEDIGEMMFNLVDGNRIHRDEGDTAESFANGYDFTETFLGPYQT